MNQQPVGTPFMASVGGMNAAPTNLVVPFPAHISILRQPRDNHMFRSVFTDHLKSKLYSPSTLKFLSLSFTSIFWTMSPVKESLNSLVDFLAQLTFRLLN